MEESILTSIKKLLGVDVKYTVFDSDIIMHINTVFTTLNQIGVGPKEGFMIEDESTEWTEYIKDIKKFNSVKTYIYLRVKLIFDPPASSSVLEAFKKNADELEWRLKTEAESK